MTKTVNTQRTSGGSVTEWLPKWKYQLIDKDGNVAAEDYSLTALVEHAKGLWPDQERDDLRTGKGWDIQVSRASHYS